MQSLIGSNFALWLQPIATLYEAEFLLTVECTFADDASLP
jgi:hypothetical protein